MLLHICTCTPSILPSRERNYKLQFPTSKKWRNGRKDCDDLGISRTLNANNHLGLKFGVQTPGSHIKLSPSLPFPGIAPQISWHVLNMFTSSLTSHTMYICMHTYLISME